MRSDAVIIGTCAFAKVNAGSFCPDFERLTAGGGWNLFELVFKVVFTPGFQSRETGYRVSFLVLCSPLEQLKRFESLPVVAGNLSVLESGLASRRENRVFIDVEMGFDLKMKFLNA